MEVRLTIRRPTRTSYTVAGDTLEAVFVALGDVCWGRYAFTSQSRCIGDPVQEIRLTFIPSISMPNWRNYRTASDADKRSWDDMIAALERHENRHHSVLESAANEFRESVPNISGDMSRRETDRMVEEFLADVQRQQNLFDRRTHHGRDDGVELVQR